MLFLKAKQNLINKASVTIVLAAERKKHSLSVIVCGFSVHMVENKHLQTKQCDTHTQVLQISAWVPFVSRPMLVHGADVFCLCWRHVAKKMKHGPARFGGSTPCEQVMWSRITQTYRYPTRKDAPVETDLAHVLVLRSTAVNHHKAELHLASSDTLTNKPGF